VKGGTSASPSEFRIARVVVGGWIAARMRIGLDGALFQTLVTSNPV
jgi:hypothetical protein